MYFWINKTCKTHGDEIISRFMKNKNDDIDLKSGQSFAIVSIIIRLLGSIPHSFFESSCSDTLLEFFNNSWIQSLFDIHLALFRSHMVLDDSFGNFDDIFNCWSLRWIGVEEQLNEFHSFEWKFSNIHTFLMNLHPKALEVFLVDVLVIEIFRRCRVEWIFSKQKIK